MRSAQPGRPEHLPAARIDGGHLPGGKAEVHPVGPPLGRVHAAGKPGAAPAARGPRAGRIADRQRGGQHPGHGHRHGGRTVGQPQAGQRVADGHGRVGLVRDHQQLPARVVAGQDRVAGCGHVPADAAVRPDQHHVSVGRPRHAQPQRRVRPVDGHVAAGRLHVEQRRPRRVGRVGPGRSGREAAAAGRAERQRAHGGHRSPGAELAHPRPVAGLVADDQHAAGHGQLGDIAGIEPREEDLAGEAVQDGDERALVQPGTRHVERPRKLTAQAHGHARGLRDRHIGRPASGQVPGRLRVHIRDPVLLRPPDQERVLTVTYQRRPGILDHGRAVFGPQMPGREQRAWRQLPEGTAVGRGHADRSHRVQAHVVAAVTGERQGPGCPLDGADRRADADLETAPGRRAGACRGRAGCGRARRGRARRGRSGLSRARLSRGRPGRARRRAAGRQSRQEQRRYSACR